VSLLYSVLDYKDHQPLSVHRFLMLVSNWHRFYHFT